MNEHTRTHTHTHICIYVYYPVYMYICNMYICIYVCTYIYSSCNISDELTSGRVGGWSEVCIYRKWELLLSLLLDFFLSCFSSEKTRSTKNCLHKWCSTSTKTCYAKGVGSPAASAQHVDNWGEGVPGWSTNAGLPTMGHTLCLFTQTPLTNFI